MVRRIQETYVDWLEESSKTAKPFIYACLHDHQCYGLGDRLAGIQDAFSFALEFKKPLRVHWSGLEEIFECCLFKDNSIADWKLKVDAGENCHINSKHCDIAKNRINSCKGFPAVFENANRGCLPDEICSLGEKYYS